MDRTKFQEMMKDRVSVMSKTEQEMIMTAAIAYMDKHPINEFNGSKNVLIAIEENSELTEELIRCLTDNDRKIGKIGLLEELADVCLGCRMLTHIFSFTITIDMKETMEEGLKSVDRNTYDIEKFYYTAAIKTLAVCSQHLTKTLRAPITKEQQVDIGTTMNHLLYLIGKIAILNEFQYEDMEKAISVKLERLYNNIANNPDYS